ncbi:hypothetical protein K2173_007291 [Erythroxylum novogranatense]|uniref:DEAD/DEAH-box helicase domain-containing protein n=1 Tax=Erythroxylum novogranatense TaxID=1862640 RepID=A0AAV8S5I4_9ROSI|nr:hypothetical protein K2173_007291 [Erythroxylum novogranatense]
MVNGRMWSGQTPLHQSGEIPSEILMKLGKKILAQESCYGQNAAQMTMSLVSAPTGSGKTICAEFVITRNHQKGPDSVVCAVYTAPLEAISKEQYRDWGRKFGEGLVAYWKYVRQLILFIIDELHQIGGPGGPILEVISSQMENKVRNVPLPSLSDAEDVGEWIG